MRIVANRGEPLLSSPKVGLAKASRGWYRYYAGYSTGFVRDTLRSLPLPENSLILDPWNGSGTTTYVAAQTGLRPPEARRELHRPESHRDRGSLRRDL